MTNKRQKENKIKKIVKQVKQVKKTSIKDKVKPKVNEVKNDFWGNLGNFVKKSIDCCLE